MFDYARNLKLAAQDAGRRVAIKAAAGTAVTLGAGFLLAALWTFLARTLGWGPLVASLVIGVLFVGIGAALLAASNRVRHPAPTTDDLKAEVETRLALATDVALEKARLKATEVVDTVENRVHSVVDEVAHKASRFADSAEARVQGFTRNVAENMVGQAAQKVGLTPRRVAQAEAAAERFRHSNAATIPPLVGAFAVGIALASRLQSWRHRDEDADPAAEWDAGWEEDWSDEWGDPYGPDDDRYI